MGGKTEQMYWKGGSASLQNRGRGVEESESGRQTERKGGEEGGEMRPQIRIGICSDDVSVAKGWSPR